MVLHQKKQKKIEQGDVGSDKHGDAWIYTAIKSDTKLHLAHCTGKGVQGTANKLITTVKSRGKVPDTDNMVTFVSGGNNQYTTALLRNFDPDTINYGQLVKERESGRVVGKTRKIIFGDFESGDIETVYVERYNLTLRHGISRLVRKSLCFLKCSDMLDDLLDHTSVTPILSCPIRHLLLKLPKGSKTSRGLRVWLKGSPIIHGPEGNF